MMKKYIQLLFTFSLFLTITSCGLGTKSYPETVFESIAYNGNKIPSSFKQHFTEIRAQLKAGNLIIVTPENEVKKVSASEYIESRYAPMFDEDIKTIKELKPNDETAQMLKDALDMFQYADDIYKNDFPKIAKMIDNGSPNEEIDAAIAELDATKGIALDEKRIQVMEKIMAYADKYGIEYKIMNMPNFGK